MKNHSFILPAVFMVIVFLLNGCGSTDVAESKDVSQSKIYQDYFICFNDDLEDYYCQVMFRFGGSGGTTLHISEPGSIQVNQTVMSGEKLILRGFAYTTNISKTTTNFEFLYTDINNQKLSNKATINPLIDINIPDSISKTHDNIITFGGNALGRNEKLVAKINGNGNTYASVETNIEKATSITLTPDILATLQPGTANIQFIRTIDKNLDETTELGGRIKSQYFSKKYVVKIVL